MKLLYILAITSAYITTVVLQEPPPIFNMDPPPPIDSAGTDKNVDQTASAKVDTIAATEMAATNETLTSQSNETVAISEASSADNDSSSALTDLTSVNETISAIVSSSTNETVSANGTTGVNETLSTNVIISVNETETGANTATDNSVSTSNVSGADISENSTEVSNATFITFPGETLPDIVAAVVEESAINNTKTLTDIQTDNVTSADTSNMTAVETLETQGLNFTSTGENVSTSVETAVETLKPQDSNFTSTGENVSTPVEANATDALLQTEPVDLPPPPIPSDIGLQSEFAGNDTNANVSDTQTQLDMNMTSAVDTKETLAAKNKTYIDEVNIYIDDGGVTTEHTPVKHIGPEAKTEPKLDLPPVPVDVPPPPEDKPSVDFIEGSDSTTIEISDLFGSFAGLGAPESVSTPMENTTPEITTQEMPRVSMDSVVTELAFETTTQSQHDIFTTQPAFVEYDIGTTQPETRDPAYIHDPRDGPLIQAIVPPPDHPPPIFSGGSRPAIYTDPYGPHEGYFPVTERPTTPKPVVTKEAPPPPIIVQTRPDSHISLMGPIFERTTASPYSLLHFQTPTKHTISGLNPRHMNVAELAAYALQMTSKKSHSGQNAQGIQEFFPTEPQTTPATTTQNPETTVKQIQKQQTMQQGSLSNAFVEYLRKRYGMNNVAPTTPVYTTTAKQAVRIIQKPELRKFYDAEYLLSHLADSTTQTPPLKKFFDSRYLLSHLDMSKSKPMIPTVYTTTPKPTTTKHFFGEKYLLSHLDGLQGTAGSVKSMLPSKPFVPQLSKHLPRQTRPKQQSILSHTPQARLNDMNLKTSAMNRIGAEQIQSQSILKEQRQGQVETRPINLKPNINSQSFINYNVNPERNVRMNINLKPDINQWREQPRANMFTQPPSKSNNAFATLLSQVTRTASRFKPVVYGTKPFNTDQQSAGLSLRKRFNKKWYHPEQKKVVKQISKKEPSKVNQEHSAQVLRGNTMPGTNTGDNNLLRQRSSGERSLQHTNIEVQRQILKQQEIKLRQQQQQLQEQEAILLRQQQHQKRQQQQQQQLFLQQSERDRLIQLKLQQEQQKQKERLLQQTEHDRLLQQRQLQQKLQQESQRQQQHLKQQETLVQQREHDRVLQLQLQRQLQLQKQRQIEQNSNVRKRNQQVNTQNNQLQLASRTGRSEILKNRQFNVQQRHHIYKPNVQLSSIQIFRAPAMLQKRRNKEIQRSDQPIPQTHWRAPSNLKNLHGHLPVHYNLKTTVVPEATTASPVQTTPATHVYIATVPPPTIRRTTQPPLPTVPATADPNPPPIFDTKVRHTFMPMQMLDFTSKAPKLADASVSGVDAAQKTNANIDERCHGCVFVNDRCLLPDPVHCNFYIECVKQGNSARAFSRECALGSFFDRKSFLCVDPKNADCPTDRCRVPGTKWYAIQGHCKHYWSCGAREGGGVFAQSECCPAMGGFVEPGGCVENPNCTDTCSSPIVMEGPPGCQLRKTASPTVYFDGNANLERPCAPGTLFNEQACTCVQDVSVERSESRPGGVANCTCSNATSCSCSGASQAVLRASSCLPMLSLPFDGGSLQDASHNKQHVGVEGISATMEGEALSNGGGRLVLWRYANLMFPVVFAIKFRFLSTTPSPRQQIIFSNCDTKGGQEPSIVISLDTLYHEVVFNINTYKGPAKRFAVTYQQNKWTTVDLIYDGERIVGSVNKRARNIFAGGGIETRPHALGVGSCNGKDGFKGLLDDIFVYEDCIPDEMYGVFMSVLE